MLFPFDIRSNGGSSVVHHAFSHMSVVSAFATIAHQSKNMTVKKNRVSLLRFPLKRIRYANIATYGVRPAVELVGNNVLLTSELRSTSCIRWFA